MTRTTTRRTPRAAGRAPEPVEWLNYHHLLYFYTVAKEGSVTRAAESLRLAQPTLSGQVRKLEDALEEPLFDRVGRGLELTETGRLVYGYAEEIFQTGREMMNALRGRPTRRPARLLVGVADAVPKMVAYQLLETALELEEPVQLVLREGKTEDLVAQLAVDRFDMLLTDVPLDHRLRLRAFNHPLGGCDVGFFARPDLAARIHGPLPDALEGQPLLLPTSNTALRGALDRWLEDANVQPTIVAEIEDSALMKSFGAHGRGVFPAPMLIADEICAAHGVVRIGETDAVREHFYAITVERRIAHPAVAAIAKAARSTILS